MEFDNTNTGALFNNKDKKTTANHPDYKGSINVNGQEFWLSAWIKPTKKDPSVRFMSLSVQPKQAQQTQQAPSGYKKPSQDAFKARQLPSNYTADRSMPHKDAYGVDDSDLPPF